MVQQRQKRQKRTEDEAAEALRARESEAATALMPVTPRGEATRRRILDAAEAVFGAKGYYEASVTEITQRAQVAQGTFYLYFRSKREIFLKLVEDLGVRMRASLHEASQDSGSRLAMERDGFRAFFAYTHAHPQLFRIVQAADLLDQPTFREYYTQLARPYERGLRKAMAAGEIRKMDAEALAYALIGIGHFLAQRWLIWSDNEANQAGQDHTGASTPELPERVFATLLDFLAHGLEP